MHKLLTAGKTDLLENFVSNKTRRKFKAYLAYDNKEGKVELRVRAARGAAGGEEGGASQGSRRLTRAGHA